MVSFDSHIHAPWLFVVVRLCAPLLLFFMKTYLFTESYTIRWGGLPIPR